jgi:hypothetical protein
VVEVEHLGVNLGGIDVEEGDLFSHAADETRVGDRRPDRSRADDRDLAGSAAGDLR